MRGTATATATIEELELVAEVEADFSDVGEKDGASVTGANVGVDVGETERDGINVGIIEGRYVGSNEGEIDGTNVGVTEGENVGVRDGSHDGEYVGMTEGNEVG